MDLQKKKIVFFVDSITDSAKFSNPNYPYGAGYFHMVKSELDVFYPQLNVKLYNEGISGNKTENLLDRFDKDVVPHKPDLVVLFIGINDVWHPVEFKGMPVFSEIFCRLDTLIEKIEALNSKVVIMTPFLFPTDEFFSKLLPIFDEFSVLYKKYLDDKKVEYIDLYEMLKPYSILSNNRVTKDSVHPTPFGHGLIAQAVIDYLFK